MKKYTLYKAILHNCKDNHQTEKGFTLIEAISTLLMGSIILGAAFSGFFQIKQFFGKDKLAVDVNQRLRTAFQTMGPDLQQIGEGIGNKEFPAIALSTNNGTSEITIRRGGLTPLTLCRDLKAGSTDVPKVLDGNVTTLPACVSPNDNDNDGWPDVVKQWQNHRNGNTVKAYILDTASNKGESFEYNGEETFNLAGVSITPSPGIVPTIVQLKTNNHTWQNDYKAGTTAIYLFDEKTYKLTDNTLQLIVNGEVFDLVEDIEKLEIKASLQKDVGDTPAKCKTIDLTGVRDCAPAFGGIYTWDLIKSIDVTIKAQPPQDKGQGFAAKQLTDDDLTLSQQFLPRNRFNF